MTETVEVRYTDGMVTHAYVYEEDGIEMYRHVTAHGDGTETVYPELYSLDSEEIERVYREVE